MQVGLLGPLELQVAASPVLLGSAKERTVLAALAVSANTTVSDDRLVDALWGAEPPATATSTMRVYVSRLRKAISTHDAGSLRIESRPGGYVLSAPSETIDIFVAERLIGDGRAAAERCDHDAAALLLNRALSLWRGPTLGEFRDHLYFQGERARLDELQLAGVEVRIDAELALGRHNALAGELDALCTSHPLRERMWELRMLALYRCGRQADALRVYQQLRTILADELGIDPSPDLRSLEKAVLEQSASLAWAGTGAGVEASRRPAPTRIARPVVDSPVTRYVQTSDGVHIAYQVTGNGPVDLVYIPGWFTHLEHNWSEPSLVRYAERLRSFARLILLDKRGTGMSDRGVAAATLEDRMEDVRAVMDAVGCERAAVCGISEGGPLAALFAATYPDRTAALIFYGSVVKWLAAEDFPWGLPAEVLDLMTDFADHNFGTGPPLEFWAPSVAGNPSLQQWWAESERLSSSPGAMKAQLEMNRRIDVRPILPSINVPTLVLHRADDVIINVGQGRYLAEQIPGAKYVELAGADHIPFYGDSDSVVEEIEEFLTGTRHAAPADRVLSTVLFTDIVGSTELAARLGDASWRHLLDRHDVIARREVERWRGRPVKSTGDGVLATFDGPARAIRCAAGLRDALGAEDIAIRAGVHTGEIELRGEDVGGIAVHIAARVESHAEPGEVLVSRTVTDLVAGSGIEFVDRGTHVLKGVPGSSQLLAVASV